MEQRRLGKTEQMSSLIAFGGAALGPVTQAEADAAIDMAVEHGVNHFDVAPIYGEAEIRLGPWMEKNRKEVFLACKTHVRSKTKAWESIKRSLERLRVDQFDLYQFHGVDQLETLNVILGPGGALEAVLEAKEQGLIRHIGITGHRPYLQIEALNRFEFDTVLVPISPVFAAHPDDFNDFATLLELAHQKDVGIIAMKTFAKRRWLGEGHRYRTGYEPFNRQAEIDASLWYTLSQGVTTAAMPGDLKLWPMVIDAAERFRMLEVQEQADAVRQMRRYWPLFYRELF
jgi:aryl-alcohol dehydrogenase-like predicted oxidoreductase